MQDLISFVWTGCIATACNCHAQCRVNNIFPFNVSIQQINNREGFQVHARATPIIQPFLCINICSLFHLLKFKIKVVLKDIKLIKMSNFSQVKKSLLIGIRDNQVSISTTFNEFFIQKCYLQPISGP